MDFGLFSSQPAGMDRDVCPPVEPLDVCKRGIHQHLVVYLASHVYRCTYGQPGYLASDFPNEASFSPVPADRSVTSGPRDLRPCLPGSKPSRSAMAVVLHRIEDGMKGWSKKSHINPPFARVQHTAFRGFCNIEKIWAPHEVHNRHYQPPNRTDNSRDTPGSCAFTPPLPPGK
jgi:hypothetical protein